MFSTRSYRNGDRNMDDQITDTPVYSARGIVLLPEMIVQVDVSRNKSKGAVEDALLSDERLFVVQAAGRRAWNEPEKRISTTSA
jgi:ATP-dependent Lon protease